MTYEQLAESYLNRLRRAQDPHTEVQAIAADIRGLVWTSNQKPLTRDEQLRIVEAMEAGGGGVGRIGVTKTANNQHFLQVVRELRRLVGQS